MVSNEETYIDLYSKAPLVSIAGDCKVVGKIAGAIHSGYFAARDIGLH
jgi:hypothetical protein